MRTTIDMSDEQRARLLHLAARRGVKGFSALVQEAVDEYLRKMDSRNAETQAALAMRGVLKGRDAEELDEATTRIRETWR